jgi:uncharacterized membrane protein YfcA
MLVILAVLGVLIGLLSGFFGIGGGTMLVPLLLYFGYDIKTAVGISITQMVFSSIYGSYLNHKKGTLDVSSGTKVGIGGLVGGLGSGYIVNHLSNLTLSYIFLAFVVISIAKFFASPAVHSKGAKDAHPLILFAIGFFVALFAMSVGVGGSILITPILASLFRYDIKKAVAIGLFFVIFSSLSGFVSLSFYGLIDYQSGFIIGLFSLIGVYLGIHIAHKTDPKRHKNLILMLYIIIFLMMLNKIFNT